MVTERNVYKIYVDKKNAEHVYFRLFINGSLSGELCMRVNEFECFRVMLIKGSEGATENVNEKTTYEIVGWI